MQKNGVTLLELLIVIIVIAILVSIGVPVYTYRIERTKGERAIANIELIKDAIKMYYVKYNTYPFPSTALLNLATINTTLGLELTDDNFTYNTIYIEADEGQGIRATRIDGIYTGNIIKYRIHTPSEPTDGWDNTNSTWSWMP